MDTQELFMENQADAKIELKETGTTGIARGNCSATDGPIAVPKKRATDRPPIASIAAKKIRYRRFPVTWAVAPRGGHGPSAVRVAVWKRDWKPGSYWEDGGNITVALAETKKSGDPAAKYLKEITATCTKHAEQVIKAHGRGIRAAGPRGDHSVAAGTVSGVAEFYRRQEKKIGLIWIDAHSDINTPDTSPSGNVHGMPLAASWD